MSDSDQHPPGNAPRQAAAERPTRRSIVKTILQIVGFFIGIGLLVWCASIALKPENQTQLAKLAEADWRFVAGLLVLSVFTMLISGEVFRQSLRPVKSLGVLSTHSTNAIANLLALLPFKLGLMFRVVVHNRRDAVPLLTIGAWFAAISAIIVSVLFPIIAVSIWRHTADAVWIVASLGGVLLCAGALLSAAMLLSTPSGWQIVEKVWQKLPLPERLRFGTPGASTLLARAQEGVRILASPWAVGVCVALRLGDIGVQAGRFVIAATIVGQSLPIEQAVLAGSMYFLIGALAPSGQLGAREAGTAGFLGLVLKGVDIDQFIVIVFLITAAEALVLLLSSMIGIAYLRPDRLLRLGHKKAATTESIR